MSTQHAHTHRPIHISEHRGLTVLLALALVASGVIAVAAILSATRPATTALAPSNASAAEQARLEFRRGEWTAGYTAPAVVSAAALDQHERHMSRAAAAEQARLEFRRGEWTALYTAPAAALDQHERHMDRAAAAEAARLSFRQGEWNIARDTAAADDRAQLEFRRGEWSGK